MEELYQGCRQSLDYGSQGDSSDRRPSTCDIDTFVQIAGSLLYPAAGMMVMALEGMRQIANPERIIAGYRVENVVFHKAMMVSYTVEEVETQLLLPRRHPNAMNSRSTATPTKNGHVVAMER